MPNYEPAGPWQQLLRTALELVAAAGQAANQPLSWSFGGGTVLMLHINHRRSKDIDIFLEDSQLLGFFNPRISDSALRVTPDFEEGAGFVKLFLAPGEIDVVVAPLVTPDPVQTASLLDHEIALERPAEIIAKKMRYRGDRVTARDLFDLAAVATSMPEEIEIARPFMQKNAKVFVAQLNQRREILQSEFEAIDRLDFDLGYDDCVRIAQGVLA